nr:serine/threonine-protein kinase [Streptomyces adelaidensis]
MVEPLRHGTDPGRVGPFELMARLGSGGMGSVYLARRTDGGLLVALKTIRAELSAEPGYRERFAREIEIARAVLSVHTAQLVDFDAEADTPWLATELVHGPNLADVPAGRGRLPDGSVRVLAATLVEAPAALHTAGIVPRYVKPSNIILAETGPRLVDFGVARPVGQVGLTSTGQFVGSVVYASPEQLLAQRLALTVALVLAASLLVVTGVSLAGQGSGPWSETDRPGAFDGMLTFPLLVSDGYVLRYSFQDDYSDVELGTATVPHLGISRYSDEFFAVALSADRTSGGLQLVFASAGDSTLRSPQTSCLNQGGAEEYPEGVRLLHE